MDIYERLKAILKDLEISGSKFDSLCGFSRGYILKTIERRADIGYERLMKILTIFEDYSPQWLLLGKGDMKLPTNSDDLFMKKLRDIRKEFPAICIADKNGKVVSINDKYAEHTGYELKEIKGKRPGDYLRHTDFPENLRRSFNLLQHSKDSFFTEIFPNYHKLGYPIVCRLLVFPIIYRDNIDGFLSFANFEKK
ncbi:PAS domain S-box protein [Maribacter sp. HTCC2170]|uniref:PAS domain S-box protein n=1 Tax=Maribacter sp. (strain HTCC2170 / KCCM 42371) TaxID=313603 RepID=UPI00006B2202|nr:PAS domain S-box protein [Maribacter sp. HTCC2170]EAR00381.1 hypothetical protein FB2170_13206 [Maribacter sp. HTCC2170]